MHAKKMLKEWGVKVPVGGSTMSIYQIMLIEHGDHNFIKHADKKLKEWGVEIPVGGNTNSIHQIELLERDKHNFIKHPRYPFVGTR